MNILNIVKDRSYLKDMSTLEDALHEAIRTNDLYAVQHLVLSAPKSIEDSYFLCLAAEEGYLDIVKYLVENTSIDPRDKKELALKLAFDRGHEDIFTYLQAVINRLNNGDAAIIHNNEKPILDDEIDLYDVLLWAVDNNYMDLMPALINIAKADCPEALNYAVEIAADFGRLSLVKDLAGSSFSLISESAWKAALKQSKENGHTAVASYLQVLINR